MQLVGSSRKVKLQSSIQDKAEAAHEKLNCRSITVLPTGTGKSYYAIKRLDKLYEANPNASFLFIGAREVYGLNFKQEIIKFNKEYLLENIIFICTRSATKHSFTHYDGVILDEIHKETKAVADFLKIFLKQNPYSEVIGLTATPKHKDYRKYDPIYSLLPVSFEHYAEDAIDEGLSNDYRIKVLLHPLNTANTIHVKTKKWDFYTSEQKSYDRLFSKYIIMERIGNKFPREIMLLKSALKNFDSKITAAKQVIKKVDSDKNKVLLYAGSIKNTDHFDYPAFHSGLPKEERESNFTAFQSATSGVLVDCAGLKESVNIKGLNYSIITHLDASATTAEQIRGRLQRLDVHQIGTMIILCAKDTIEAVWTEKALSGFDQDKIEWMSLDTYLKN